MSPANSFKYLFSTILFFVSIYFWAQNTAPTLTATGDQYYCPQSKMNVVTDFNIIDDDTGIEAIFVQISEGYINGEDELTLAGNHPNIIESWSAPEGKLTLKSAAGGNALYVDLIAAVKDVVFESSNPNPTIDKSFSITIGDANYLPSTGHFYQYVSDEGITWTEARDAAEALPPYYGVLTPYLATLTSSEEAKLCGEQALGTGWIGGSDVDVEGTWRWVTGPEGLENGGLGRQFWQGTGTGTTTAPDNFAFWNTIVNEPNQDGNEDYAHIVSPNLVPHNAILGSWNDLSNTGGSGDYASKGYLVEYGMPGDPPLNISASTTIKMAKITGTTTASTCGTGTVGLTATSNTGFVIWFDSLTGGSKLASGNTYSPTIFATKDFYALASSDGVCEDGPRTAVTATYYSIPTITSTNGDVICESGSATLTASASAGTINWYDAPTGGNFEGTGTSFPTPNLTSTTTYYVDATENGCTTTTRTPVTATVQKTSTPTGNTTQTFCDIENATISNLTVVGNTIQWYANSSGGTPLNATDILTNGTNYYASQTVNGCESPTRLAVNVLVFETVIPSAIMQLEECDTDLSGSDTDGKTFFDLKSKETELLNDKDPANFNIKYFKEDNYLASSEITTPSNFENTSINGQTIYARIFNNLDNACFTNISFEIQVNALPVIQSSIEFKNCDEDGNPDGFTDFNLEEANPFITNNNQDIVTYYLTFAEADNPTTTSLTSPFNNQDAINNEVFARVENTFGCYRVATVNLDVSATKLSAGFNYEIESCDQDDIIDGKAVFDLTEATQYFISELPPRQNLSVHYYRNLLDAQLEQNEILTPANYENETTFSQTLYVRVENDDNGACFGIGEHLTLIVHPRPEFEVNPEAMVCLNLPPITLETFNPNDVYSYKWTDELNNVISNQSTASVSKGGVYTVVATSTDKCTSFERTITVSESNIASFTLNDITVTDDSNNNSITINTSNLGIGDYEFVMDDIDGFYKDEPIFSNVPPGIRTIYVRDKNNCGIASIEVSVIGFPKFFTPNNDGKNDTWNILGATSDFFTSSQVYIFDRFGKLVAQFDTTDNNGWDGTFNGEMLSSTDYWFKAQLVDLNGNIREKSGHFSLIRH